MITVSLNNAYTGSIYSNELSEIKLNSFDEVIKYSKSLGLEYRSINYRLQVYTDDIENIKQIPLVLDRDISISDINEVLIEYTSDMCPIIQVIFDNRCMHYVHDYYSNLFKISAGDVVCNKRDYRFYYITQSPDNKSLQDIMWNDDMPNDFISMIDIYKPSEYEFNMHRLDKLVALKNANSKDEYYTILNDILNNHPRLLCHKSLN